ncbi:UNVERIFIED_CONTAM: hypothetical protein HDU68_010026 [Siphonaria sp. JEL0065]|nr:hypothetical protein HDU68_010026 [Siphonaria sp. JEL0065]
MAIIEGRILSPPPLTFGPNNNPATAYRQLITSTDGTWRIGRNLRFARPAILNTWAVALFGDPQHFPVHIVSAFVKNILGACCGLGMEVSERNLADVVVYAPMPASNGGGPGRMGNDTIEATFRVANERALRGAVAMDGGGMRRRMGSNGSGGEMWEFDDLIGVSTGSGGTGVGYGGSGAGFGGMVGQPAMPGVGAVGCGSDGNCILAQKNTFDFFLTSHPEMQGTSKAAHYHVLYDNIGFDADTLQEITYRLCYNFARRFTRAVSIAPPAYYAHLVAARARCYASAQNSSRNHWRHNNNNNAPSPGIDPLPMSWGGIHNGLGGGGMGMGIGRSFSSQTGDSPILDLMFPSSPALSSSGIYGGGSAGRFGSSVNSNVSSSYMTNFGKK